MRLERGNAKMRKSLRSFAGASDGLVELEDVFKGLLPYIAAGIAMLMMFCVFPNTVLYLSSIMTK